VPCVRAKSARVMRVVPSSSSLARAGGTERPPLLSWPVAGRGRSGMFASTRQLCRARTERWRSGGSSRPPAAGSFTV